MKTIFGIFGAAFLLGCTTTMQTASGRPETTINAPPAKVRAEITDAILNWGYSAREGDNFNLVFEKDAGTAASIFMGSLANPTVIKRCRFTLIERDGGTRVVAGFAMLSASSRRETETPGRAYNDLQYLLDLVKARCQGDPEPVRPPPLEPKAYGHSKR